MFPVNWWTASTAWWEFSVALIVIVVIFIIVGLSFRNDKYEEQELRCPKCGFLVDAEDVERYGNVCPDCRTNWRVYPLKKGEEEN